MGWPHEWERSFAGSLHRLSRTDSKISEREKSRNRAILAGLRRGLGKPPGVVAEMHPFVVPRIPEFLDDDARDACYFVASLFAVHLNHGRPDPDRKSRNLGASFAVLQSRNLQNREGRKSTERRMVALLNSNAEDLSGHLRHAIRVLASNKIPVDFAHLLHDIQAWEDDRREVQQEWANAYWIADWTRDTPASDTDDNATTESIDSL